MYITSWLDFEENNYYTWVKIIKFWIFKKTIYLNEIKNRLMRIPICEEPIYRYKITLTTELIICLQDIHIIHYIYFILTGVRSINIWISVVWTSFLILFKITFMRIKHENHRRQGNLSETFRLRSHFDSYQADFYLRYIKKKQWKRN